MDCGTMYYISVDPLEVYRCFLRSFFLRNLRSRNKPSYESRARSLTKGSTNVRKGKQWQCPREMMWVLAAIIKVHRGYNGYILMLIFLLFLLEQEAAGFHIPLIQNNI